MVERLNQTSVHGSTALDYKRTVIKYLEESQ